MNEIMVNPPRNTWAELVKRPLIGSEDLEEVVSEILETVRLRGDAAVKNYAMKFHGVAPDPLWVTAGEIAASANRIDKELKGAVLLAAKNIRKFHKKQVEKVRKTQTAPGVVCWRESRPLESVGLYIPGGSAPLFSTLLMLGIPATLSGCRDIVVSTPADRSGKVNTAILFAAHLLGITRIYKGGGAQAIGAMAYGTQTMGRVAKIFGPGNQYVNCAKKLVSREGVAIDMLAGPSELAIYADQDSIPAFLAADLLSQAEHGADSQVVLIARNKEIIHSVLEEIRIQLPALPRRAIIEQSLLQKRLIVMENTGEAFDFLNCYAPEHLIIASENAEALSGQVQNAGSVFLGNFSPESAGDYASGTNHSLPTNGLARTQSGVSVDSFVKKITFQKLDQRGIKNIGSAVERMAEAEGLSAHKNAVSVRLKTI